MDDDKQKRIWEIFVKPLLGACPTCSYGGPTADADDCMRDDYDGSDPACVDDWWEDNTCVKWKLASWLDKDPEPDKREYIAIREINCMKCRTLGHCEITFTYTEGGKVESADITQFDDGWKYLRYGDAGGSAPYCPNCY